jgi:hypothetical protein
MAGLFQNLFGMALRSQNPSKPGSSLSKMLNCVNSCQECWTWTRHHANMEIPYLSVAPFTDNLDKEYHFHNQIQRYGACNWLTLEKGSTI